MRAAVCCGAAKGEGDSLSGGGEGKGREIPVRASVQLMNGYLHSLADMEMQREEILVQFSLAQSRLWRILVP